MNAINKSIEITNSKLGKVMLKTNKSFDMINTLNNSIKIIHNKLSSLNISTHRNENSLELTQGNVAWLYLYFFILHFLFSTKMFKFMLRQKKSRVLCCFFFNFFLLMQIRHNRIISTKIKQIKTYACIAKLREYFRKFP